VCLANGRPEAAEYLASRGAPVDFESAAGVGRLDVVQSFFSVMARRNRQCGGDSARQRGRKRSRASLEWHFGARPHD